MRELQSILQQVFLSEVKSLQFKAFVCISVEMEKDHFCSPASKSLRSGSWVSSAPVLRDRLHSSLQGPFSVLSASVCFLSDSPHFSISVCICMCSCKLGVMTFLFIKIYLLSSVL